jgi:Flp pilus assembly protein CpaB
MRLGAVALVGVAAWLVVRALVPAPPDTGVPTVVTVRALALGSTVAADDVRVEQRPSAERPEGAMSEVASAVGQVVAGPLTAGEILTSARFRGAPQLSGLMPGLVAVSLPVTDQSLLTTLRPAQTVTVLAAGSGETLATAARVLATDLPGKGTMTAGSGAEGHMVVAVTADEARALAAATGPRGAPGGLLVAVRG